MIYDHETNGENPGVIQRIKDWADLSAKEIAIGSAMIAGSALFVAGINHISSAQENGIRDSLNKDAETHIQGFDHVIGKPTPVASFKDTNLADIALKDGRICHVDYSTPNTDGNIIGPTHAEIVDLNNCPEAEPLRPILATSQDK